MSKIAINGFGRIGRPTLKRIIDNHPDLEMAAINDLTDNATLAHLLKYDSLYGTYNKNVQATDDCLNVAGKTIKALAEKEPANLPWKELGIDIVLECTGAFTKIEDAKKHLTAGAKKVIISAPSKSEEVPTYLLGVNEKDYDSAKDNIISMGSCSTNALAPVAKLIHKNFVIKQGFMSTIHSYTNAQRLLDAPHKDLRRARAAAVNIVPTTTGAAKAVTKAIPELEGKLDGIAFRVPTATVSVVDFICQTEKTTSNEKVNKIFKEASRGELKGILDVSEKELVSMDFKGNPNSAIVDLPLTMVKDNLIKVVAWYDNEWGYACRLAEMAEYLSQNM